MSSKRGRKRPSSAEQPTSKKPSAAASNSQRSIHSFFSKKDSSVSDQSLSESDTPAFSSPVKPSPSPSSAVVAAADAVQAEAVEAVARTADIASLPQRTTDIALDDAPIAEFDAQSLFDIFAYNPYTRPPYWTQPETPYQFLTDAFTAIDAITSRIGITSALTNVYRTVLHFRPQDLLPLIWLSSNHIAPEYEGVEMGIGGSILVKVLTSVTDATAKTLKAAHDRLGDMGDVAWELRSKVKALYKPKRLLAANVFQTLHKIAALKGPKTQQQKADLLAKMLVATQGEEVRYLVRTAVSNLRIGAVRTTVLIAAAHAVILHTEYPFLHEQPMDAKAKELLKSRLREGEALIKECFSRVPNYNVIVPLLIDPQVGIGRLLDVCKVRPGIPIRPMLGKITRGLDEIQEKLKDAQILCDVKYDGQRAQIHLADDGAVTVFSRHLENMTEKYPDIVKLVGETKSASTSSFIIDAEVVAVDSTTGALQSFQTLSNRSRKNVQVDAIQVRVCVMAFDIMFLNGQGLTSAGQPLLQHTLRKRREMLASAFNVRPNEFQVTESIEVNAASIDDVSSWLHDAIRRGCEGLMIKLLDEPLYSTAVATADGKEVAPTEGKGKRRGMILSTYEPDKRSDAWLKVKKDYLDSLADSVDAVPIAAWYGNGRKAGWFSPFLLAVWNPDTGCFDTLTKVMSGFSDAFYKERLEFYTRDNGRLISGPKPNYNVSDQLHPDVWFEPSEVWEIRGADFTLSTVHSCGSDHPRLRGEGRGVSLRFPRFIRVRDDKKPEEGGGVTTIDEVVHMWEIQVTRHSVAAVTKKKAASSSTPVDVQDAEASSDVEPTEE
ncbi:hypothetical protein RI367_000914 [Sorochytrium milnesiophthora]